MPQDSYDVGYRKPPTATRFQPGQSGNPKGTRRPRKTLNALLDELLHEKLTINEHGRQRRLSKLEVILRQFLNKAATGDPRATRLLLDIQRQLGPEDGGVAFSQSDQDLIAEIAKGFASPGDEA